MAPKRAKSVKHAPPAPSSEKEDDTSNGAGDFSPEEEAPKTLTPTPKSHPAKPQPSNTKTPIPQNNDSGSEDDESESKTGSESETETGSESESELGKMRRRLKIEDVENDLGIVKARRVKYDAGFHAAVDMGDFVMNNGLELLSADKRTEMKDEWKKLQLEALNLYTRKQVLLKKMSVLIAAALQD